MIADYGVKDVVLYVSKKLRCFRDTAKLIAIIFLAQYDVEGRVVSEYRCGGRSLARAEFYIWHTGILNNEIYDVIESEDFDMVQEALGPALCYSGPAPRLPQPAASRLSDSVDRYGDWKPWQLRFYVKKLLGLDIPERLNDYIGHSLYTYIRAEGFHLETREVCDRT